MAYKVSVIIPTYKRSEFLGRAIDSVLNQNYNDIEIIVVDDNTPDSNYRKETEERMNKFVNKPGIIYLKNQKNLGGALARNEGINISTGDLITFLDDDDIFLDGKLEKQVKYMLENNLDLSFSNVQICNERGKVVDYRDHSYIKNHSKQELLKNHLMHHLTPTGTYMFKKDALLSVGSFDNIEVGQEYLLMLKSITRGLNIGYLPFTGLVQYVHSGERISVGNNKIKKEKELLKLKEKYYDILKKSEIRYIKFRHYAVLSVVGLRSRKIRIMLKNLIKSFLASPTSFVKEIYSHFSKFMSNYN